jgi:hypothetical protein
MSLKQRTIQEIQDDINIIEPMLKTINENPNLLTADPTLLNELNTKLETLKIEQIKNLPTASTKTVTVLPVAPTHSTNSSLKINDEYRQAILTINEKLISLQKILDITNFSLLQQTDKNIINKLQNYVKNIVDGCFNLKRSLENNTHHRKFFTEWKEYFNSNVPIIEKFLQIHNDTFQRLKLLPLVKEFNEKIILLKDIFNASNLKTVIPGGKRRRIKTKKQIKSTRKNKRKIMKKTRHNVAPPSTSIKRSR